MDEETTKELVREIFKFHRATRIAVTHATPVGGLGAAPEGVLRLIGQHNGCRASDLAAELGIGPSSLSRQIGELEDQGLIRRRTCPTDKRAQLLTLSDAGSAQLAEVQQRRAERVGAALGHWSEESAARAVSVLAELSEALRTVSPATARTTPTGTTTDPASPTLAGALS